MPPTRLVPASLTVQSVVLVEGGGAAIEQWMELVQRRKRTDTGTLETMAACRGYSERLPPPLASTPPTPLRTAPACLPLSSSQPSRVRRRLFGAGKALSPRSAISQGGGQRAAVTVCWLAARVCLGWLFSLLVGGGGVRSFTSFFFWCT